MARVSRGGFDHDDRGYRARATESNEMPIDTRVDRAQSVQCGGIQKHSRLPGYALISQSVALFCNRSCLENRHLVLYRNRSLHPKAGARQQRTMLCQRSFSAASQREH
jgi:hypothetical protein